MLRYRCHAGHAFAAETVLSGYAEEIEKMAGSLLRSQQERAAFVRRMGEQERAHQREGLARQLESRAKEYEEDARLVRELIQSLGERTQASVDGKENVQGDEGKGSE